MENLEAMRKQTSLHLSKGVPVGRIGVMAAFGCNYQGDIAPAQVIRTLEDGLAIAADTGAQVELFSLADTMGWATPARIEGVLGEVRSRWPEKQLSLHLHDTRGLAVANAHAGLRMGVSRFDSTVGGLGGCPFAGQKGAAGNICTEELVLLCEEMGIHTGVDLDRLIEVGRMAVEFGAGRGRPILHRHRPRLGEHNREVLVEAGFSLEEVAALAEQRVIVGS